MTLQLARVVGCRVKVGKTQLMGTPQYGEPIPVAWGDGRAHSGLRPAETGAVAYDGRGVCVCVCLQDGFLWLILHLGYKRGKAGGSWEQQREPCRQWGAWAEASMRLIIQVLYVLGRCSLGTESLLKRTGLILRWIQISHSHQ